MSTVGGVEFSSVMISWLGPEGISIVTNSRATISPTTSSGNNYNSSLNFVNLLQGDRGNYTCSVMILDTTALQSVELQSIICKLMLCSYYIKQFWCMFTTYIATGLKILIAQIFEDFKALCLNLKILSS